MADSLEDAAKKGGETDVSVKANEQLYVCKTKCYYNGWVYEIGDTMVAPKDVKVPEHFAKASK